LHEVSKRLGYQRSLEIRLSDGRFPPLVWALGRPKIILSRQLAQQLSAEKLSGILAHEIAHLLRRDHWVRWLELIVFAFAWWHPVAWWARDQLREAEEEACDARVVASWEGNAEWYVHALLAAIDCASNAEGRVPSLANGLGSGSLTRRVKAMVNRNVAWRMGTRNWVIVALMGALVLPLSVLSARAEMAGSTKSPAAVTLAELREGVQKMEQRISTLSVKGESETENHFRNAAGKAPAKGIIENNAVDLLKRISSSWVVDSTGRTWQKHSTRITTMTSDNTRLNNEEDLEAVFDGKQGRTLKISHSPAGNQVLVDKTRSRWNYHIWSPLYYTIWHIDGPVSQILLPPDARIVGTETWEGQAVVVAEAGLPRPPSVKQEYKTQIWVDPARNFVIVRRRVFARYAKDRPWHLHLEIASFELEEASPGIWLPKRVEMKNFAVPPVEPKDLDLLVSREKIQYRDWKVNENVPDAKISNGCHHRWPHGERRPHGDSRSSPPRRGARQPRPLRPSSCPRRPNARQPPGTLRPADNIARTGSVPS
jgi:hypothetical protein